MQDKTLFIYNANIIFPDRVEKGGIIVKSGKIIAAGSDISSEPSAFKIDAKSMYVSAGFVDMHLHGGGGSDFMDGDLNAYKTAVNTHIKHGTTSFAPTTLGSSREEILRSVEVFIQAKDDREIGGRLLGLHLEGPYISKNQAGAQPPEFIREPDMAEYDEIIKAGKGNIIRWSVAPELSGMTELSNALKENNILPSIAHSDADYFQIEQAYKDGFTLITHLYSSMSTIKRVDGFRVLGVVESAYLIDGMNVEIIADGCHLPPELLRFICKLKDNARISLVTDSMRASGQDVTVSFLGTKSQGVPCIIEDGVAKLTDRSAFAGSIATADRLIRTIVKAADISIAEAVKMMTVNPLKALGLDIKKGIIKEGYDADLVIFDEDINIKYVIADGEIKFYGDDE